MAEFYVSDSQRLLVRFDLDTGLKYINPALSDWEDATPAVERIFFCGDGALSSISEEQAKEIFDKIKSKN